MTFYQELQLSSSTPKLIKHHRPPKEKTAHSDPITKSVSGHGILCGSGNIYSKLQGTTTV